MATKPTRQRKKAIKAGLSFEQALARLEEIAESLETGDLSLEEAISLAEEGQRLVQSCEKQLTEAEGRIQRLVERSGAPGLESAPPSGEEQGPPEQEQ